MVASTHRSVFSNCAVTMAYLMLYGNGWTQRWRIADGMEDQVRSEISQVGSDATGRLGVVDPGSDAEVTLLVSWALVAAAVVIGEAAGSDGETPGQYP
jgi:hypothetical protein